MLFSTAYKIHTTLVKEKAGRRKPCANFVFVMVAQETVFFGSVGELGVNTWMDVDNNNNDGEDCCSGPRRTREK